MEFRVLDPLLVHGATGLVTLGSPRQRALLATLLLECQQGLVSVEQLIDELWGDRAGAMRQRSRASGGPARSGRGGASRARARARRTSVALASGGGAHRERSVSGAPTRSADPRLVSGRPSGRGARRVSPCPESYSSTPPSGPGERVCPIRAAIVAYEPELRSSAPAPPAGLPSRSGSPGGAGYGGVAWTPHEFD